jgi:hypothetical protein
MHELIRDKIIELEERIEHLKNMDEDVTLARELMPDASVWLDFEVNINWACSSMDEVKDTLKRFAEKGCLLRVFDKSDTNPAWRLNGKNATIRLSPTWSKDEGAACKLIQVGLRKEEYPVYKLVCPDLPVEEMPND